MEEVCVKLPTVKQTRHVPWAFLTENITMDCPRLKKQMTKPHGISFGILRLSYLEMH